MKGKGKYIPVLLCTLAIIFLIYHLDKTQRFLFFYREQGLMFIYDIHLISERYLTLGGFSLIISHFIEQFFSVPLFGPIATALIGGVMSYLLWLTVRQINQSTYILPLCFLPLLYQVEALFDFNYDYHGFVSFFLAIILLYVYAHCSARLKWTYRIVLSCVLSIGLYILAGSTGLLLSLAIFLYDLLQKAEKGYLQIIPVALTLLLGFYLIISGEIESARFAYMNDYYFEPTLKPVTTIHFSWLALLGILIVVKLISFIPKFKTSIEIGLTVVCFVLISAYFIKSANKNRRNIIYPIIQLQHYVVNEKWDDILNSRYIGLNNYLIMNYANLALSHKGMLLSDLFSIPQDGPNSLMLQGNTAETTPEIWSMSTHILYQMGNIASARNVAFDSFVANRYGNPSITKMMAKTDIIYGDYTIAEKYIKLLEKTWGYSKWAKEYRRFLFNDEAVNSDPELGLKRKDLPPDGTYPFVRGVYVDLLNVLDTGVAGKATQEYAIAFLLLTKDAKSLKQFIEKYADSPYLKEVPTLLQEAILEMNEKDLDYCREHGVTEETINRHKQFLQKFMDVELSGLNPAAALKREFGRTYWYYSLCN